MRPVAGLLIDAIRGLPPVCCALSTMWCGQAFLGWSIDTHHILHLRHDRGVTVVGCAHQLGFQSPAARRRPPDWMITSDGLLDSGCGTVEADETFWGNIRSMQC